MPIFTRELPSFSNVQPGGKANVGLEPTKRYAGVLLEVRHDDGGGPGALMTKADMKTYLAEITLRLSGANFGTDEVWEISGENMIVLNDFYGVPSATGVLPLMFALQYWDQPDFSDFFSLGTADLKSVELDVKLDASVQSPEIVGYALEYTQANAALGRFIKLMENTVSAPSVGTLEVPDLPVTGDGIGLKAQHLKTPDVGDVEVKADGTIVYEDVASLRPVRNSILAQRTGGRTGASGFTHLDFAGNNAANIINTTGFRDFRLKLDMQSTGSFTVISETVVGRPQSAR